MDILLTRRNIDELPSDCIVLTFFSDEKPLQGETGLLDWRMDEYISKQLLAKKITGKLNENLLIPSSSKIKAKKIFLFGLGETQLLNEEKIDQISSKIMDTLKKMHEEKFAFVLSRNINDRNLYLKHLKTFFKKFSIYMQRNISSIYYHYEKEEEKETLLPLKSGNTNLFEERIEYK